MILTTDRAGVWQFFGASVRGPLHQSLGLPNQDAWLGHTTARGAMIAVCDGLGSRPMAKLGAIQACLAARDAINSWNQLPNRSASTLPRLIRAFWEMRTAPAEPDQCATTCLFAAATRQGRLIIGGLGDGLALLRFPDGNTRRLIERGSSFTNQTLGLGVPHKLSDWVLDVVPVAEPHTAVVLATDGIADDLVEDRMSGFANWLCERFLPMPPSARYRAIEKELRNWPTPSHQDDKTVAVLTHAMPSQRES